MGSICGLKSNLLLVRPVHLQHSGSKPLKKKDLFLMKMLLMNSIAKKHNVQVVGIIVGD